MSDIADWVESSIGAELSESQREAVYLICNAFECGPWNVHVKWKNVDWKWGNGVRFCYGGLELSTFDARALTNLVILAHERCVRVSISPRTFHYLSIEIHPRKNRDGRMFERHPTIEQAIELTRERYGLYPSAPQPTNEDSDGQA